MVPFAFAETCEIFLNSSLACTLDRCTSTTGMLIAAMAPMAFGVGHGAASRAGHAKVIMGGQALSLLLTLLITPVTYSYLDDLGAWIRRKTGFDKGNLDESVQLENGK